MSKRTRPADEVDSTEVVSADQRTVGLTEAGIGLSLITCLLVALGYVIIQRLGDRSSSHEAAPLASPLTPGSTAPTAINGIVPVGPNSQADGPPATYQTSYPPQWLPPQQEAPATNDVRSAQRPDGYRTR